MLQFPLQANRRESAGLPRLRRVTPVQLWTREAIRSFPGDPKQQGGPLGGMAGDKKGFFLFHRSINELSVPVPKRRLHDYDYNSNFLHNAKNRKGLWL